MFSTTDHFKRVECPTLRARKRCDLYHCIFSHNASAPIAIKRTKNAEQPQAKRIHLAGGTEITHDPDNSKPGSDIKPKPLSEAKDADEVVKLIPATLQTNPATLTQRMSYLKTIYQLMVAQGFNGATTAAIQAEKESALKSTNSTYPQNIRLLAKSIKNGTFSKQEVKEVTSSQLRSEMEKLVIPVETLEDYDYITKPVISDGLESIFETNCARCGAQFNTSDSRKVKCKYHPSKPTFKYSLFENARVKRFQCCSGEDQDSEGCCTFDQHVFKLTDPAQLSSVLPFTHSVKTKSESTLFAAGIDCEMGYTNLGLELIRVTVVDWETKKTVLDRTVYPYGKVIDLNTKFSGVKSLEDGITINNVKCDTVSFKEARNMISRYVSESTILIGHGLENDLKALRLVHNRVIDTALLYPRYRPTRRLALKDLAFKYLSRKIQSGEHDSAEDALAAMDVVEHHLKIAIKTES